MVDVSRAFSTSSETISDFFTRPGIAFYIPLYQREYSWDKENIEQLIDDICHGANNLISKEPGGDQIRFLGTIILVRESNPDVNINPKDSRALPSTIFNVIDGQQRISTIALLACLLYQRLFELAEDLDTTAKNLGLQEAVNIYLDRLSELFSFDLKRGNPLRKPLVIRGSIDGWTLDGSDDANYKSDVSSYISKVIRSISEHTAFPSLPKASKSPIVGGNLKRIHALLGSLENSNTSGDEGIDFPSGLTIFGNGFSESELWSYERPALKAYINELIDRNQEDSLNRIWPVLKLFVFCNYLLDRCCFTAIEPVSDEWAFDMFQSLNATGTPLTAIETFKPLVVNYVNDKNGSVGFKSSRSDECFTIIDSLFNSLKSASDKSKLTNDYLSIFGASFSGEKKPSRQFSDQRRWLNNSYENYSTLDNREEFVNRMSDLALYWQNVIQYKASTQLVIPRLESEVFIENSLGVPLGKVATLCAIYLQDSGHKMANAVLSRYYSKVLRDIPESKPEFSKACLAIAAYFTLWRSALSNTGLDETYRVLLQRDMSWKREDEGSQKISTHHLKAYFRSVLERKGIHTKELWLPKACQGLRYDNIRTVCRFALFVSSHNTEADHQNPGLMKAAKYGTRSYMEPEIWRSDDFKTIEHIAPRKPDLSAASDWDTDLYNSREDYEQVGNLTLLPTKINSSAGNRRWVEKWIYYSYLSETNLEALEVLSDRAFSFEFTPKESTVSLLKKAKYNHHIVPVVEIGPENNWNLEMVENRTERICSILWDRISKWLEL